MSFQTGSPRRIKPTSKPSASERLPEKLTERRIEGLIEPRGISNGVWLKPSEPLIGRLNSRNLSSKFPAQDKSS